MALIQTPHRFRTKRQLWAYSGLALETRISAEYRYLEGQMQRSKKLLAIRGLNPDHNHDLKGLLKAAATTASARRGLWQDFYQALLAKGMKPTMARLTLARKIAAVVLTLWKKGAVPTPLGWLYESETPSANCANFQRLEQIKI